MIAANPQSIALQWIGDFSFCVWPHFDRNKSNLNTSIIL